MKNLIITLLVLFSSLTSCKEKEKENINKKNLDLPNFVNDNYRKTNDNVKKTYKKPKNNNKKFKSTPNTSKLIRSIAITSRTYSISFWSKPCNK